MPEKPIGMPNPASEFCIKKGGKLKIERDEQGNQFGICHLPDGTVCEEWKFFKGECGPGRQKIIEPPVEGEAGPASEGETQRCRHVCKNIGTRSEGWYDSCTGKLIEYAKCEGRTTSGSEYGAPGEPISLPDRTEPCIQVITFAVSGGLCRAFPTPCDVPSGWRKVDKCPDKPSEAETRQPTQIIPQPTTIKALPQTEAIPSIEQVAPTTTGAGSGEGFKAPDDKGMIGPEGSLGKPSLFERFKKLFTR